MLQKTERPLLKSRDHRAKRAWNFVSGLAIIEKLTCIKQNPDTVDMLPGTRHMQWSPEVTVMGFH